MLLSPKLLPAVKAGSLGGAQEDGSSVKLALHSSILGLLNYIHSSFQRKRKEKDRKEKNKLGGRDGGRARPESGRGGARAARPQWFRDSLLGAPPAAFRPRAGKLRPRSHLPSAQPRISRRVTRPRSGSSRAARSGPTRGWATSSLSRVTNRRPAGKILTFGEF